MPLTIPDDDNDRALSAVQKRAFLWHTEGLFDIFEARARIAGTHTEMAEAAGGLIQGLFEACIPYLKGAAPNPRNPHDPNQSGKGFKKRLSTDLKQIVDWRKWPLATVSDDADSFYCPSLREWVRTPEDCPDLFE
jgi:hypothetical protein